MQNEFRIAFEHLPPMGTMHGERGAAVAPRIDLLARALFLEGVLLDVTSVASMIVPSTKSNPIDSNFFRAYRWSTAAAFWSQQPGKRAPERRHMRSTSAMMLHSNAGRLSQRCFARTSCRMPPTLRNALRRSRLASCSA